MVKLIDPTDPLDPIDTEDVKKSVTNVKRLIGWVKTFFGSKKTKTATMVFICLIHFGCLGSFFKVFGSLPIPNPPGWEEPRPSPSPTPTPTPTPEVSR